ncbi:MAG TPA: hypothetical protein VK633_03920, partial [Verrucomicrobiae bacterium]|nr:hypothetical protein [Verrucomicrobiae bacterium]
EYNLCTLPPERIDEIIKRSIAYFRAVLQQPDFCPASFRAGNWLFQPTRNAAAALAANGLKVDSSVFKGGVQHKHKLDYRGSLRNGDYWFFSSEVNLSDPRGALLEIPIYSRLVPPWKMLTGKRIGLQKKASTRRPTVAERIQRFRDFARLRQPLKFDFCRMNLDELISITEECLAGDQSWPQVFRPMVAIGHSKDLVDFDTIDKYLGFLKSRDISVSTLESMHDRVTSRRQTRITSSFAASSK